MQDPASHQRGGLGLRSGDLVRIRSREEILATLGPKGTLGGLPFMPEMLKHCGETVRVQARADKTCDTIGMTGTSRQMERTVHLSGQRCDGSAHGGCQAGCLLFWREEWLERRQEGNSPTGTEPVVTEADLHGFARTVDDTGETVYRCQATELLRASTPLSSLDPRQYVADVRSGNASLRTVLVGLAILAFNKYQRFSARFVPRPLRIRDGQQYPFYRGTGTGERMPPLDLAPGELVEVRSKREITATLSANNTNRGLYFDYEMLPYCGHQFRVDRKVERIIHEPTGRMLKLSDCVVLDGVICQGNFRRFCRRAITPYWREGWLRRVPSPDGDS